MQPFAHGDAIKASLALAADRAGDITPLVYDRLFARHPAMHAEFWRDRSGAIRGEMLARVFEIILDLAGPRAYAAQMIGTEFITHDAYGIPRPIFGSFFAILAETLEAVVGPDWTPAMAAAWAALLTDIDTLLASTPDHGPPRPMVDPASALPVPQP